METYNELSVTHYAGQQISYQNKIPLMRIHGIPTGLERNITRKHFVGTHLLNICVLEGLWSVCLGFQKAFQRWWTVGHIFHCTWAVHLGGSSRPLPNRPWSPKPLRCITLYRPQFNWTSVRQVLNILMPECAICGYSTIKPIASSYWLSQLINYSKNLPDDVML